MVLILISSRWFNPITFFFAGWKIQCKLSWFVRLGGRAFFILAYKVKLLHSADAALVAQLVEY